MVIPQLFSISMAQPKLFRQNVEFSVLAAIVYLDFTK